MGPKNNAVGKESPRRGSCPRRTAGAGDGNTRQKILSAAKKIFSLHAFKAATTRMIAQEAGVDHPLIHYHFGSKEMLFEQIAGDMYEEFGRAHRRCFDGLPLDQPREGLSLYLDRLLGYCVKNPEQLQLILLNIAQIGRLEEIPGYRFILMHLDRIRETFRETVRLQASREEVDCFILCFHSLVISFVGARSCQARVLGLDPESREYLDWIKEALWVIFLPQLERMMAPPGNVPGEMRNEG
jgi:AcrR family transcriptional regulator